MKSKEYDNKRYIGNYYEEKARHYLEQQGLIFLVKNFRCRFGEIDLIMRDQKYYVFVEVKYRDSEKKGCSLEAVNKRKQRIISKVAAYYLRTYVQCEDMPCRFDVVGFDGNTVSWIKDAFDFTNG